jgi:hypothetical protein
MDFDVFISYSVRDRKLMKKRLEFPLVMEGFTVAIDYSDFNFGELTERFF